MKNYKSALCLFCLLALSGCLTPFEKLEIEMEGGNKKGHDAAAAVSKSEESNKDRGAEQLKNLLAEMKGMPVFPGTSLSNEIFKVKIGEPVVDFCRRVLPLADSELAQLDMSMWLYKTLGDHYPAYIPRYDEVRSEGRLIPVQSFILKQDRLHNELLDTVVVSAVHGRVCAVTYTTMPGKGITEWKHGGHNDEGYIKEEQAVMTAVLRKLTGSDQLNGEEYSKALSLKSCGVIEIDGKRIALIPCQSGAVYSLDNTFIDLSYLEAVFSTLAGKKAQAAKQADDKRKKALDAL